MPPVDATARAIITCAGPGVAWATGCFLANPKVCLLILIISGSALWSCVCPCCLVASLGCFMAVPATCFRSAFMTVAATSGPMKPWQAIMMWQHWQWQW
eukprot:1759476-Rhodomonas_salina.4